MPGVSLKVKRLYDDSLIPRYAHPGDAGLDVFSHETAQLGPGERRVIGLGFSAEFPEGYVALVWDRGSTAIKSGIRSLAGVIDSGYRGEWRIVILNVGNSPVQIQQGDKIAQVLIQPVERVDVTVSDDLAASERGEQWCGSTG